MTPIFVVTLTLHVIFGIVGTIFSYATVLSLLKSEVVRCRFLSYAAVAWVGYMISWISGGYYYWFWYGPKVKPLIIAEGSSFVWAHKVVMEAKEHIFLMLPIASLVLLLIAWSSTERVNSDPAFKKGVLYFAITIAAVSVLIALSGIIITGGAR